MTVTVYPTELIAVELLDDSEENPNEQSADEFSALVEEIQEHGWLSPTQVIGPQPDGRYKLFGGHHRKKAAIVLGMEKIPCVVVPPEEWDDDLRKLQLVKQNILQGKLNPTKFTALYEELASKYSAEVTKRMMGFTKEDAFQRLYDGARAALPPEMAEKLDEVRDELKTVDDLSLVLNQLFTKYGSTLPFNFMVFTWGGKESVMVALKQPGAWKRVKEMMKWCQENELEMDAELMSRMSWPV